MITGIVVNIPGNAATASSCTGNSTTATTAATASDELGVGQTYQDVSVSRAFSTLYSNATARPILLNVRCNNATQCNYSAIVNGVTVQINKHLAADAIHDAVNSLIIPAGATYQVNPSAGTPLTPVWIELR